MNICIAVVTSVLEGMDKWCVMRHVAQPKWMTPVTCNAYACNVQVHGTISYMDQWQVTLARHARVPEEWNLGNGTYASSGKFVLFQGSDPASK